MDLSLLVGLCVTFKLCFSNILAVISEILLIYGRAIRLIGLSLFSSIFTSARRLCNHLGLYVCVCVCVYVCLSVNTITQKIINILTSNFAHTFTIA